MSFTLLIGLLLNKFLGFWWAVALAAFAIVYFIVREGSEALDEARTGETCNCGSDGCF
jgi:divalent metal cation (Fe/Co/Zn/Cd) transporter